MNDGAEISAFDASGQGLRILIENSEYWLRNNGDLAMMAMTIERLHSRWPMARIGVLTDAPSLLRAYFPQCEAITVFDPQPWGPPRATQLLASRFGPRWVGPIAMTRLRSAISFSQKGRGAIRRLRRAWRALAGDPRPVVADPPTPVTRGSFAAVKSASLLLSLGGGYLTDADAAQTNRVFNLIEHAHRLGVPVALVGQGLGPINEPALRARAAAVLPQVALVALREKRRGPGLLDSLGVAPDTVMVTGDDAIELAYDQIREHAGTDLGFCVRVANYAPVTAEALETVGRVVRGFAAEVGAPLAPLVIAEYKSQDRRSTLPLVHGHPIVRRPPGRYVHPRVVASRVAQCRVMVTGAYHLGVFALSQGIPVVALTSSAYYDDKFLGLADMFETGLQLIDLNDPELASSLSEAIQSAWQHASDVREPLRASARSQIATSKDGLERVFHLVERSLSAN